MNYHDIVSNILIAALSNNALNFKITDLGNDDNYEILAKDNQFNAEQIAKVYDTIYKSVSNAGNA